MEKNNYNKKSFHQYHRYKKYENKYYYNNYNYNDNDNNYNYNYNNFNNYYNYDKNYNKTYYDNEYNYNFNKKQFNNKPLSNHNQRDKENNFHIKSNKNFQNFDLKETKLKEQKFNEKENKKETKEINTEIKNSNSKKTNIFSQIYSQFLILKNVLFKSINELISNPIYNKFISIDKIKQKICEIFDVKNEEDIYQKLLQIFENNDINNENCVINLLKTINSFIEEKIISINQNGEIKKEAINYLINKLIEINIVSVESFIEKFIFCFQIKEDLTKFFEAQTEDTLNHYFNNKKNSINFIRFFGLQNKYSFKNFNIINEKDINFPLINNLYHIYNNSGKELLDLNIFILSKIPKNSIPLEYMIKIFKDNNKKFNEEIRKSLINDLLEISKEYKTDEQYSSFYSFIFNNNLMNYYPNFAKIDLEYLVYNLSFYKSAICIIKTFNNEERKKISKILLNKILFLINLEDKDEIKFILELIPESFNKIAKNYIVSKKTKELKILIKEMNNSIKLNDENCEEIEKFNIKGLFYHRVKKYFDNQIDTLIECVNNQIEYEIFILIFLREMKEKEYNTINKLSYVLNYGDKKGFYLPEIYDKRYIKFINEAKKIKSFKIPDDKFGPRTENCIAYTREEINVLFIQTCSDLIKNFDLYYKNTEFIGIDSEWKESLKINIKTKTAIIQLSDFDGKNIFILDIVELTKDINFEDTFEKLFSNKKFISFEFNNDLINFPEKLSTFFKEKVEIIDITNLYSIKYFEQCPSFSKVCEKLIGKPLCKYEQCSNWEKRPLRESQFHYAALDALLYCLIYKKIIEN